MGAQLYPMAHEVQDNPRDRIPPKWLNFARRIFGLKPGRWVILLTVEEEGRCTYEIMERGKAEK